MIVVHYTADEIPTVNLSIHTCFVTPPLEQNGIETTLSGEAFAVLTIALPA